MEQLPLEKGTGPEMERGDVRMRRRIGWHLIKAFAVLPLHV